MTNRKESLLTENEVNPKQSSLRTAGKLFAIAALIGAVSYSTFNGSEIMMPEEIPESVDPVVENPDELVEMFNNDEPGPEYDDTDLINDVSVGCRVNIDRLNDQDKPIDDWNANINGRSKYMDSTFPARKDYALYWKDYLDKNALECVNGSTSGSRQHYGFKDVTQWQRPAEFDRKHRPLLWGQKGVQPHGIKQGGLGNCYFLAAAAAMAEHPDRVKKLFQNKRYSSTGIFMVHMYVKGQPVKIVVDDQLPVYPNPTRRYVPHMYMAKPSKLQAWWGPILEKAYCKMNIACTYTNSGTPLESFRELTGMPTEMFDARKQSDQEIYKVVKEAVRDKWMMVAGTMNPVYGIQGGHAYTITDAQYMGGQMLLELRNPWGRTNYKGPWNDADRRWTPAYERIANLDKANTGVFWVPVSVFKQAFGQWVVCMYQDWKHTQQVVKHRGKALDLVIRSPIAQTAMVTFDYQNSRQIPPGCHRDQHNPNLFIAEGSGRGKRRIAQKASWRKMGYVYYRWAGEMKANQVYTITYHDFAGTQNQDFTIHMYAGKRAVSIQNLKWTR